MYNKLKKTLLLITLPFAMITLSYNHSLRSLLGILTPITRGLLFAKFNTRLIDYLLSKPYVIIKENNQKPTHPLTRNMIKFANILRGWLIESNLSQLLIWKTLRRVTTIIGVYFLSYELSSLGGLSAILAISLAISIDIGITAINKENIIRKHKSLAAKEETLLKDIISNKEKPVDRAVNIIKIDDRERLMNSLMWVIKCNILEDLTCLGIQVLSKHKLDWIFLGLVIYGYSLSTMEEKFTVTPRTIDDSKFTNKVIINTRKEIHKLRELANIKYDDIEELKSKPIKKIHEAEKSSDFIKSIKESLLEGAPTFFHH